MDPKAEYLANQIEMVVVRLNDLAARVARAKQAVPNVGAPGAISHESYAELVSEIQNDVIWGLANLKLDGLVNAAYRADAERLAAES